jgi:Cof subfamily protein (haloacid dehalogenase superfamily)
MVIEQTGPRGPVVCSNGAMVYDPVTAEIVAEWPIDPTTLDTVMRRLRDAVPQIAFAVEYGEDMLREDRYPTPWDDEVDVLEIGSYAELVARPAAKLLARLPDAEADALLATVDAAIGSLATPTHSSFTGLVEISAAGVDKGTGLAHVADHYGVAPADVIAFGDMPNDLPMLDWAGHAIAVGNAHPEVRALAKEHAGSNDDDGVAAHLERLFDL